MLIAVGNEHLKKIQVHFGDSRVDIINMDYLLKNGTKSNILIQVIKYDILHTCNTWLSLFWALFFDKHWIKFLKA